MSKKAHDGMVYWFAPPPNIAPSQKYAVRFVALKEALAGLLFYFITLPIAWLAGPGDVGGIGLLAGIGDTFGALFHAVTHGRFFAAEAYNFANLWTYYLPATLARLGLASILPLGMATYIYRDQIIPRWHNMVYISGPRLLDGKAAVSEAIRETSGPSFSDTLTDQGIVAAVHRLLHPPKKKPYMSVCPSLGKFSRTWWTKHLIIVGKPGSGKTMILLHILDQIVLAPMLGAVKNRAKSIILDAKGDFTSFYKTAMILNPWDNRSGIWDIAKDLADVSAAKMFAQCLLPASDGNGKFFDVASQKIMVGVIRTFHHTHGGEGYGFTELSQRCRLGQQGLADLFAPYVAIDPHIELAYNDVKNPGPTVDSVLSTLSNGAALLTDLAMAWPTTVPNDKRPRFSCKEWSSDDWKGPRHILLRGKSGNPLTVAFISALFNMLTPQIMDLEDSKKRHLFIVCDEFTAPGKLKIEPLIDKGRSKGCCVILGYQDPSQIAETYSTDTKKTILSMIGSKIICQIAAGDTATELSEAIGRMRVLVTNTSTSATPGEKASQTSSRNEETRLTVATHELSDPEVIGPYDVPTWREPAGFRVRAILSMGKDALRLSWPGHDTDARIVRPVNDPASWAAAVTAPLSPTPQPPEPPEPNEPAPDTEAADTNTNTTPETEPSAPETAASTEGGLESDDAGDPDDLMGLLDDVADPMDDDGGPVQALEPPEAPAPAPVAEASIAASGETIDDGPEQVVSIITRDVRDPVAAAKLASKAPTETVGDDLDEVAGEVARSYAADAVGEAIGVVGLGGLLDAVKIVDMYHESKTPTGPTKKQTTITVRGR
ncbi:type IV secretion system DNA-binding domain-containing protein [Burkholderia sp. Ax-1724]|uniref:type IV secretion system DNA-binding domain-containing protein n=1 Tax=Burkholderia sp. Ax-1724 TaxID=2608336 RepID=UPI001421BCA4|nr:type IV secretion system DNA-binding domain-containing protein [Burkholderia sp. Ax-1724]